MPANRFFLDQVFAKNQEVSIGGSEHHHLSRVMRAKVSDTLELVNGKNTLATATITAIKKDLTNAAITTLTQASPPPPLILAIPFTQTGKLDFIIEKGCELGATTFWLYKAKLGEKESLSQNHQKRLHTLLISAMKQCGRLDLPTIALLPELAKWNRPAYSLFFGDTRTTAPRFSLCSPKPPLIFVTGPEKGFSPSEIETLETTLSGQGVCLHQNILRMETAPLVALVGSLGTV